MAPSLDASVRAAVGEHAPGVALVVVGPEGVRASASVGFADLGERRAMTTSTAMPWFSMTKIATATVAVRMAELNVFGLDEPVSPLVPSMRWLRPEAWARRITARQLMQHSSGLKNPIPVRWIHPAGEPGPDPVMFLDRLLSAHPRLRCEPGTRSSYSNLGTLVLGAALATGTGIGVEKLVEEQVLDPLGMFGTGFSYAPDAPAAVGYHPKRSPMRPLLPRWVQGPSTGKWLALQRFLLDGAAYGGLVGTAHDAARFLQMHLRDGEHHGSHLITAGGAQAMRRIDMPGRRYALGLGWFVPADAVSTAPPFVEHLGGGAGFFNVMRLYPTAGVGAVVMGNATRYPVDDVARLALAYRE
jgi:CubicO group peptidase (beta-lactamase class C family)